SKKHKNKNAQAVSLGGLVFTSRSSSFYKTAYSSFAFIAKRCGRFSVATTLCVRIVVASSYQSAHPPLLVVWLAAKAPTYAYLRA
ncbi:MAG: hypothetical protein NXI10_17795, partial [bacterium]|nr:hypothetical protein [bacterium]